MKKQDFFKNYSRRTVIKALGLTTAAPFVPVLTAQAADSDPKRLLIITTPNGLGSGATPTDPGSDYKNGQAFEVLDTHKKDINIYKGLDFKAWKTQYFDVANSHPAHAPHLLTAQPTEVADPKDKENPGPTTVFHAKGKSIDQVISQRLMADDSTKTALPYIYAGVKTGRGSFYHQVYSKAGASLYPQTNATTLHNDVFSGAEMSNAGDEALKRRLSERRSVIDHATSEINAVMNKLANVDKQKMQDHLDAIRDIETQLAFEENNTGGVACVPPSLKNETGSQDNRFRIDGENMMDVIVQAFACDRTRVATLMWSNSANGIKFTSKGLNDGHHGYTHSNIFSDEKIAARDKISEWYAERFVYLLNKMKAITEGSGSMLDNTMIIWTSEHGNDRREHDRSNIPFITAGSCNGAIKTGHFFDYRDNSLGHGDMYVTAAHAMGYTDINKFGIPQVSNGPLPGVLA